MSANASALGAAVMNAPFSDAGVAPEDSAAPVLSAAELPVSVAPEVALAVAAQSADVGRSVQIIFASDTTARGFPSAISFFNFTYLLGRETYMMHLWHCMPA